MSATRLAAQQGIAPLDVALMRYGVPAILLLPVWLPTFRKLKMVTASLKESSVVYFATIVPCTMPIFAVAAEKLFFNQHPTPVQLTGFSLIALAAVIVIVNAVVSDATSLSSLALMFLAAAGWACYVVAFRHTGLTAAQGAAWVSVASTIIILVIKLVLGTEFLPLTTDQLIFNVIAQGLLSGFVAVLFYTIAIDRLGSAHAASFSVLMPALGSFFAWAWLGETPSTMSFLALLLGTLGVAVINGLVNITRIHRRLLK